MPEWLQVVVAVGSLLTPFALAALARDRALLAMIGKVKDDAGELVKATTDPLHERVNRVRDEYVRRDDLNDHLARIDKRFDDMAAEQRRANGRLDEIRDLLVGHGKSGV